MIGDAKQLNSWLRAQMPALDESRYLPWNSGTPTATSLVALIHLRVQTPSTPDQGTTVVLVAHRYRDDNTEPEQADSNAAGLPRPVAPQPGRAEARLFRVPRRWRTRRAQARS